MRLTAGGNVLINTTTDNGSGAKLQVDGKVTLSNDNVSYTDSTATLVIDHADGRIQLKSNSDGSNGSGMILSMEDDHWSLYTKTDGTFHLGYNSTINGNDLIAGCTDFFVIDKSGRVGIGTTSPAYTLDVAGSIRYTGSLIPSDSRIKFNQQEISSPLEKAISLANAVRHFEYHESLKQEGTRTGFIAQLLEENGFEGHISESDPINEEVGEILGWEYKDEVGTDENGNEVIKRVIVKEGEKMKNIDVNYTPYAFPAIKELFEYVQSLEQRIKVLEAK